MLSFSISVLVNADMEIGTSCKLSSRRCAKTIISSNSFSKESSCSCAKAKEGVRVNVVITMNVNNEWTLTTSGNISCVMPPQSFCKKNRRSTHCEHT